MLFITNRTPIQSVRTAINRKIRFNLQNTSASQHLFFCERLGRNDYTEIGSRTLFDRLKTLAAPIHEG